MDTEQFIFHNELSVDPNTFRGQSPDIVLLISENIVKNRTGRKTEQSLESGERSARIDNTVF